MFFEETGYADNNREIHYSYKYLDQNEDELTRCVDKIAAKSYDPELENLKESEK